MKALLSFAGLVPLLQFVGIIIVVSLSPHLNLKEIFFRDFSFQGNLLCKCFVIASRVVNCVDGTPPAIRRDYHRGVLYPRTPYRGTSLIRNTSLLGSYSTTIPRVLWWS